MVLRALPALTVPAHPKGFPQACPWPRTPWQPPGSHQPLPQQQCSRAGSSSPQPCSAWLWAPLSQAHLRAHIPREVSGAQGWGCPSAPPAALLLAGGWDGPWLPGPAITHLGSPWCSQHLDSKQKGSMFLRGFAD